MPNMAVKFATLGRAASGAPLTSNVMFHDGIPLRKRVLIFWLLSGSLAFAAEPDSTFAALFEKMNEAVKNRDVPNYLFFLTKPQKSVLEECLAHPACSESAKEGLYSSVLESYTIQGVEEFCGCDWTAYKLQYRGRDMTGNEVEGYVTFIQVDGVWKADTFSRWQSRK